jgi:hypothetical protein
MILKARRALCSFARRHCMTRQYAGAVEGLICRSLVGRNRGSKKDNAETQRSLRLRGDEGCIHQALQLRTTAGKSALDEEL